MNLRERELEFDSAAPFNSCQLDREKYAKVLTSLVSSYSEGFVLAINNRWGTGKTTFVKMWQAYLAENLEIKPIYFNAWENDFEDNPLRAILGELKIWTPPESLRSYNSLLSKAVTLSKDVIPILSKALLENYIGPGITTDALNALTESSFNVLSKEVDEYIKRKNSIEEFKDSLSKFVNDSKKSSEKNVPLVFIIDELDRCRPNYAVLVLEQIKHFFSVDNIVFVLSIDKQQLGHAIRGVYGSEHLDADEYLRRFIDLEYSIPDPPKHKFFDFLYQQLNFESFFKNQIPNSDVQEDFKDYVKLFVNDLELRKQRKILSHVRLVLRCHNPAELLVSEMLVFLVYTRFTHNDFYTKIIKRKMPLPEMHRDFFEIVKAFDLEDKKRMLANIEGHLLYYYSKTELEPYPKQLFENVNFTSEIQLLTRSKIDDISLKNAFRQFQFATRRDLSLETFISKIELTANFRS